MYSIIFRMVWDTPDVHKLRQLQYALLGFFQEIHSAEDKAHIHPASSPMAAASVSRPTGPP